MRICVLSFRLLVLRLESYRSYFTMAILSPCSKDARLGRRPLRLQNAAACNLIFSLKNDANGFGINTMLFFQDFLGQRRFRVVVFQDRKSTRPNSSHGYISYAVFCLKKKKNEHEVHASIIKREHQSAGRIDDNARSFRPDVDSVIYWHFWW